MYKALNYWVYGGFAGARTPYEFIDFARNEQLDGVELTVGDAIPVDLGEEACRKLADCARVNGIGLRTLASGFYWTASPGSPDPDERRRALDFTRDYLRLARRLGAQTVLVIPAYSRIAWDLSRPEVNYRDAWNYSVESFRTLAPLAEELETNIGLENVWNRFLFSPVEWKAYLDEIDSERIGLYFDAGNARMFVRPEDYISELGSRIKAVHIKNWRGDSGGGSLLGFGEDLDDGEIDLRAFVRALEASGCDGPVTAEMIPFARGAELNIPDEALARKTAAFLRSL